jgi:hypothetical protein
VHKQYGTLEVLGGRQYGTLEVLGGKTSIQGVKIKREKRSPSTT